MRLSKLLPWTGLLALALITPTALGLPPQSQQEAMLRRQAAHKFGNEIMYRHLRASPDPLDEKEFTEESFQSLLTKFKSAIKSLYQDNNSTPLRELFASAELNEWMGFVDPTWLPPLVVNPELLDPNLALTLEEQIVTQINANELVYGIMAPKVGQNSLGERVYLPTFLIKKSPNQWMALDDWDDKDLDPRIKKTLYLVAVEEIYHYLSSLRLRQLGPRGENFLRIVAAAYLKDQPHFHQTMGSQLLSKPAAMSVIRELLNETHLGAKDLLLSGREFSFEQVAQMIAMTYEVDFHLFVLESLELSLREPVPDDLLYLLSNHTVRSIVSPEQAQQLQDHWDLTTQFRTFENNSFTQRVMQDLPDPQSLPPIHPRAAELLEEYTQNQPYRVQGACEARLVGKATR